jgi:hypothetical protein
MHKRIFYAVAAVTLLSCFTQNKTIMQLTDNNTAKTKDWISLFDGKTTKGWHTYNKTSIGKAWKVENGILHFDATTKKQMPAEGGDIVTDEEFDNFHLKLEWKISPNGNSGIIFYSKEDPQIPNMWQTGPEMQILDDKGHPDAKIQKHHAGDLYDMISSKEAVKPVGEWNLAEIVANKGKLEFYLNGQQILSTTLWDDNWRKMIANSKFKDMPLFGTIRKGKIGLQDHGDDVWFRNIMIKRL